jgi:nucleoside-diphosphate-sugar epimerase
MVTAIANDVCAITGSTGYVGSLLRQALASTRPVVALVREPRAADEISWSLESSSGLEDALRERGVRTLFHAAWDMRTSRMEDMERICVQGSRALFEAAARAGVKRIVFISTISAFEGCSSAYGKSKLAVEQMLQGSSHVVLRLGLVYGEHPGGVFGGIRQQVRNSRFLPMIGRGLTPQYLLHETTLVETALRAAEGEFDLQLGSAITLAHPKPWPFRDLVRNIAAAEQRSLHLVPLPWQLLFYGLRGAEALSLPMSFRSDSVLSFVRCNRNPDFSPMQALKIVPRPFQTWEMP